MSACAGGGEGGRAVYLLCEGVRGCSVWPCRTEPRRAAASGWGSRRRSVAKSGSRDGGAGGFGATDPPPWSDHAHPWSRQRCRGAKSGRRDQEGGGGFGARCAGVVGLRQGACVRLGIGAPETLRNARARHFKPGLLGIGRFRSGLKYRAPETLGLEVPSARARTTREGMGRKREGGREEGGGVGEREQGRARSIEQSSRSARRNRPSATNPAQRKTRTIPPATTGGKTEHRNQSTKCLNTCLNTSTKCLNTSKKCLNTSTKC